MGEKREIRDMGERRDQGLIGDKRGCHGFVSCTPVVSPMGGWWKPYYACECVKEWGFDLGLFQNNTKIKFG